MKCSRCGKSIKIPDRAIRNLEDYGRNGESVVTVSECCGKAYEVSMHKSFSEREYTGDRDEDDWGERK